jgi:hypothetical protein
MKTRLALQGALLVSLLLAVMTLVAAGCASSPKPDWNQRIGHYTFDDAVRELGPPASSIRLQDGSTVAEWFLKYGSTMSFGFGVGSYGGGGAVGVGNTVTTPPSAYYQRLTFDPQGLLARWEKVKR